MNILFLACAIIISIGVIYGLSLANRPYLTALKSSISGLAALLLINTVSSATGCYIAINIRTVFMATVLSVPGVLALLVMKILFHY